MTKHKNSRKLIVIEVDGKSHELWGLAEAQIDKRQKWQFDQDYVDALVDQLSSKDPAKVNEAKKALLFLHASVAMEMNGRFEYLRDLGIVPTDEFKRQIFNSRNASQRDFVSNNQSFQDELTDAVHPDLATTISDLVDGAKHLKKKLRKQGKSINDFREDNKSLAVKNQAKPNVKTYTPEEIAAFQKTYFKKT